MTTNRVTEPSTGAAAVATVPVAAPSVAASGTIGTETLERISRLDTRGHRVLSLYVDLDPGRFPTPATRDAQLGSLLDEARREAGEFEAERLRAWLDANPTVRRGARGLALFACAQAGVFEAVRLHSPVEPLVVVDTVPWLEPLAALISPGDWGVAIVGRRSARLFRGGPGGLNEFATLEDDLHRRHAQGGWAQARFQRGIEEQVAAHVRGVIDRLLRAHLPRPFAHLVIVCSSELRPVVRHSLHGGLAELPVIMVDADLAGAATAEIAAVVAPLIERVERDGERELIARVEEALATGAAAAGLDDVLAMLEQQRVATLVIGDRLQLRAWCCPTCLRLSAGAAGACPLDGAGLSEVDAVEHAIEAATAQAARVHVARYEESWLRQHGGIAALLRW